MSYMRVICVLLAQCSLPPTLQWTQKFVFATFQCSRTIQCMVTQEGPLSSHYPVHGYPGGPTFQWGLALQPHYPVHGYPGGPTFQWGLVLQPHYPVPGYPGGPTFQWGLYFSSTAALSSAQLPLSSGHGIFQCQKCQKKHAKFRDYVTIMHELFARPTPPPFRVL